MPVTVNKSMASTTPQQDASIIQGDQQPLHMTCTRTIQPPEHYQQETAFITQAWDTMWDIQDFEIQEAMADPIAFAAPSNPDTMYLHEAMKQPD